MVMGGSGGLMAWRLATVAAALAVICVPARAQEMEPRAYSPAPVGMTFVGLAWQRSSGGVTTDPTLPITNVDAEIDSSVLAMARTFPLGGRSASIGVALPYTWADVSGEVFEASRSVERAGFADARMRLSVNLLGGPALDPVQFARRTPATTLGASLTVVTPSGEYRSDKLINLGANRWAVKSELGVYHPMGPWSVELSTGVWLFTDNDDFFGGSRREQDPLTSVQGHISYTFRPQLWIAANANWYRGGDTTVDGVHNDDLQETTRIGLTLSVPVDRRNSLKFAWSDGATTRIGSDFTTWTVGWQYGW
jgi:hypothetical protein